MAQFISVDLFLEQLRVDHSEHSEGSHQCKLKQRGFRLGRKCETKPDLVVVGDAGGGQQLCHWKCSNCTRGFPRYRHWTQPFLVGVLARRPHVRPLPLRRSYRIPFGQHLQDRPCDQNLGNYSIPIIEITNSREHYSSVTINRAISP